MLIYKTALLQFSVALLATILVGTSLSPASTAAPSVAESVRPELDVPYVPTPSEVVDKMLEFAAPTSDDFLIDLGSGDGRIPITAAKRFGTRGLGIDIDPVRISEARTNAERARVSDKVEFRQEDLFDTDISQATILTLYLLPNVNLRLRPTILAKLKPGTRVISHDFDMGDWTPDRTAKLANKTVYMWIVPASADGRWQVTDKERNQEFTITFEQRYQTIEGEAEVSGRQVPIQNARVEGERITFELPGENGEVKRYEGRLAERQIDGEGWRAKRLS